MPAGAARPRHYPGAWPAEAQLEALQPADRWFTLGHDEAGVPRLVAPQVRDISCRGFGRSNVRLRCRYRLTTGRQSGGDPPDREVEDIVARDGAEWFVDERDSAAIADRDRARGLWMGPIHLCRDTVESIVPGVDRIGSLTLAVKLAPALHSTLQRETAMRVTRPLFLTLGGKILTAPYVQEPITGGVIVLTGPLLREMNALQRAAAGPC